MTITDTIYNLLSLPNPPLDLTRQGQGGVTKSHLYSNLDESRISKWDDFTFENIYAAFGHLLQIEDVTSEANPNLRGTPTEIEKEGHVDSLVLQWTAMICRQPLKVAGTRVQRDIGVPEQDITLKYHGLPSKTTSDTRALDPDWAVYLHDDSRSILVWGDSKCSSKWNSDQGKMARSVKRNWIWPFRQMLTYCVNENVRYGFVFTPDEMVLMRVSRDDAMPSSHSWGVEYISIPWHDERDGALSQGQLTINMGLWALVMCSVNEAYRQIAPKHDVLPINVWWADKDRKGRVSYEHHLSGAKSFTVPSGAMVRSRPTSTGYVPMATLGQRTRRASRR